MTDLSTFTALPELPTIDNPTMPDVDEAIHTISEHILSGSKPKHIYTKDLRVTPGYNIVEDSFESYLSHPARQSSHLKAAYKTALHYQFVKNTKKELEKYKEESSYFNIGTYLHQCLLEPTKFSRAVVEPKASMGSKKGCIRLILFWLQHTTPEQQEAAYSIVTKVFNHSLPDLSLILTADTSSLTTYPHASLKAFATALATNSDLQPVTEENYAKIQILKTHIDHYASGIIYRLLKHTKREISFYQDADLPDMPSSIPLKVRPDAIAFHENIGLDAIISIKSTASEDIPAFERYCATNHYDLTEAMYQDVVSAATGRDFRTTITIMLQTVEPYCVALLIWSRDDIERGRQKLRQALDTAILADTTQEYPAWEAYADNELGLIPLTLPKWNNLPEKDRM